MMNLKLSNRPYRQKEKKVRSQDPITVSTRLEIYDNERKKGGKGLNLKSTSRVVGELVSLCPDTLYQKNKKESTRP